MVDILRSTLEQVKNDPELPPDDPKVIEARRWLEHSIQELEGVEGCTLKKAA